MMYGSSTDDDVDRMSSENIIKWAYKKYGNGLVMSTSFGMQSAVMLHAATCIYPEIPIIWIDTGYLPAETYTFADDLIRRLKLNVKIYQSEMSVSRMEAMHGKLWETDHIQYGFLRKVEPMNRALAELKATALLSGIRMEQTNTRKSMKVFIQNGNVAKISPILKWSSHQVEDYIRNYKLPYHPLKYQGYVSVGDTHSSRPLAKGETDGRSTRFGGKYEECGLHTVTPARNDSANSLEDLDTKDTKDTKDKNNVRTSDAVFKFKQFEVYSKSSCKYCLMAKELICSKGFTFTEHAIGDDVDVVEAMQRRIGTKVTKVPQIFIDDKYIGSFSDLHKLLIDENPNNKKCRTYTAATWITEQASRRSQN